MLTIDASMQIDALVSTGLKGSRGGGPLWIVSACNNVTKIILSTLMYAISTYFVKAGDGGWKEVWAFLETQTIFRSLAQWG